MNQLPEPHETNRYGLWMAIFAWIAVIVVLAIILEAFLDKSLGPKKSEQKIIVLDGVEHTVITRNRQNHYTVDGKINGQTVHFILDTGATDVVIPGGLAKELNLEYGPPAKANTAGGVVKIYRTKLDSISIGHIQINQVHASINPSMSGDEVLLGMSALQYVTFTQKGNELILKIDP